MPILEFGSLATCPALAASMIAPNSESVSRSPTPTLQEGECHVRRLLNSFIGALLFLVLFYAGTRLSLASPSGSISVTTRVPVINPDSDPCAAGRQPGHQRRRQCHLRGRSRQRRRPARGRPPARHRLRHRGVRGGGDRLCPLPPDRCQVTTAGRWPILAGPGKPGLGVRQGMGGAAPCHRTNWLFIPLPLPPKMESP